MEWTPLVAEPVARFPVLTPILAVVLAAVHVFTVYVPHETSLRGRQLLSMGAGTSVAYVFVLLFPEVASAAAEVRTMYEGRFFAEQLVFLAALAGLVAFYGLEVYAAHRIDGRFESSRGGYTIHLGSFTAYSALIGYLLFHQEVAGAVNLVLYTVAMGLHFLNFDRGLDRRHGERFRATGRWILAGATLVGAGAGIVTHVGELALGMLLAFLSGGLVFNTFKEEVPEAEKGLFFPFLVGASAYSAIVLFI
ncbi:hypothetical protein [Halopelagius longus]|uniref:Uncharacterized protein n=1 Tax=Halopelagius longus TaxID=1236180 RepID=A0A1H1AXL7_9EURY|nr:hypothetical protein [Halopelagius longus]RDI70555.1 hypothetical protein DWB78_01795 [Halopelagius longus]SDQ44409.1 hypothetical protein SAMN05216278_1537 [Halopelagius longus]